MGDWKAPTDCRYTKTDEWIRVEGQEALVGLTDYAQDHLSDLVYIELPQIGAAFSADQTVAVVDSVKATADIKAPASGKVIAVNEALTDAAETINQDPYGKGWVFRIQLSNPSELNSLMDAAAYSTYCDERG